MFLLIMFFLLCIAATAVITVLLRDSWTFNALKGYLTTLQTFGDESKEEYDYRASIPSPLVDLCHLIKASRDDARLAARAAEAKKIESVVKLVTKSSDNKRRRTKKDGKDKS